MARVRDVDIHELPEDVQTDLQTVCNGIRAVSQSGEGFCSPPIGRAAHNGFVVRLCR